MKYKLIASDMDGTLVNDKSELTERTKQAIINTVKSGVLFVTATGRPFSNTQMVNELFTEDMPFIVLNGAATYMGKSGKLLFEHYLDFELAKEVYEIGQKLGIAQVVWTGPQLWANRLCDRTLAYEALGVAKMSVIDDFNTLKTDTEGVSKVLWIDDPANIRRHSAEMNSRLAGKVTCVSSMAHFLEFISPQAGKGGALEKLGKIYGIDSSEMIAVGDSYNDISMLEYAGLSVAVANAVDDVLKSCDHITSSNENDGVAEVIEKFVLN